MLFRSSQKRNLSSKEKQEAFIKGMVQDNVPKKIPKPSLKRRVGYSEEEVSAMRARLSSLAIDEEDSVQEKLVTMV